MEKNQKICPISILSETGQMICCRNKNESYFVIKPLLANQIAGKPVCINWHIIMSCYELMVQICGSSTYMVEWPSSWGIGVLCLCFQAQSPLPEKPGLYLLLDRKASLQRPELPLPQKKLIVDVFFPKRVWYGKNFRQLNVYRFFIVSIYNALMLTKNS